MITIIVLAALFVLFAVGRWITGALLSGLFWLFCRLPAALVLFALGLVCCCTLILIPVGLKLFALGGDVLIPG